MFLIQEKRKQGTYLCIVQSYRDPVTKATKKKRIKNIGYLHELQKEYDDPIAHFKQVAKEMSEEYKVQTRPAYITLDPGDTLVSHENMVKNLGYTALASLYHELNLDSFFRSQQRYSNLDYHLNSVMKLLVYSRTLFPGSENQVYQKKDRYFDKMDFTLENLYDSFSSFHRCRSFLQKWIHEQITNNYGRDSGLLYYYVTNHYFEVSPADSRRKPAPGAADHRLDPILQMGLFIDENSLPVSYELFQRTPGDVPLLNPALRKAKQEFNTEKVIVVADNGVNSSDHLYRILSSGNGYVMSQSIRSADKELRDFVTNQNGYVPMGKERMVKSRIFSRKIRVTTADGRKKNVIVKEKQVVFYDGVYARWARAEREDVILKSKDLIASPGKYNKATAYSAGNYVKNLEYDKITGEISSDKGLLSLDEDKLRDEEKYDGYYLIFSSELDLSQESVVNTYSDIWQIEDAFRFINNTFHARPESVSRNEHISAHFSACFISLTLTRILEMKTGRVYPLHKMVKSMKKCNCVHIEDNYYIQTYYDEILKLIGENTGIDFSKRYRPLSDIKKCASSTRKKN